jgi:MoaA/NifB/PqqE/SkfB family radical SAM enzyme
VEPKKIPESCQGAPTGRPISAYQTVVPATDPLPVPDAGRRSRRAPRHLEAKLEAVRSFAGFVRGDGLPAHPIEIFLEVSNVCDLSCVMCPRFSALNPDRKTDLAAVGPGFLAVDSAIGALDRVLTSALVVHAFGYGEPTIYPAFGEALERLAGYDVLLDFFTNGMHFSGRLVERLVRLAVHQVTVSFSGATREHYEAVYQGGRFDEVCAGLARLRDAKRSARTTYPRVHINSLSFDHHMRSLDRFVDLMAGLGVDRIEVTRLFEHAAIVPELSGHAADMRSPAIRTAVRNARSIAREHGISLSLHSALLAGLEAPEQGDAAGGAPGVPVEAFPAIASGLPVYPPRGSAPPIPLLDLDADSDDEIRARLGIGSSRPRAGNEAPFVCFEPFKTMYVRSKGHVKSCCYMDDSAPALGNVNGRSGEAVWNGRGFAAMRAAFTSGAYPKKACGSCLANGQAPASHGVGQMLADYDSWHEEVFGEGIPRDVFVDLAPASEGRAVVDRLAAASPDLLENPGAVERERKLLAHVEDLTRLEGVPDMLLEGCVDLVTGRGVTGWLWSAVYPDLRLTVCLEVDGRERGRAKARLFRPDLRASGKGDGWHGFAFDFWRDDAILPGQTVNVRIGNTRCRLSGPSSVQKPGAP